MRAAVFKDRHFQVADLPTPEPGPGQVLVKVRACGICGSDLHFARHADHIVEQARRLGAPTAELERGLATGLVLGHEFVGEIVAFGPGTTRTLAEGDRVCSMPFVLKESGPALLGSTPETPGAYAEYLVLSEALCLKVDEAIPDAAAALVEPLGIAVHAVARAELQDGDVAVVVGCGPIGLAITAVLAMRGTATIVASDLSPRRRALARTMGATATIDGRDASPVAAAAAAAPGARMVIFENTGAPGMLGRLVLEAPQNARLVVSGIAPGEESFIPMVAIMKELQISFVIYYTPDEFAQALAAIRDGRFDWKPLVTGTVGLDEVDEAFAALADPEQHAKILIDPWRQPGR